MSFPVYNPAPQADPNVGMGLPVQPPTDQTDKSNNADNLAGGGGGGNDMDDLEARLRALDGK